MAFFRRQGDGSQDCTSDNHKDEKLEAFSAWFDSVKRKLDFEVLDVKQVERIDCVGYQGIDFNEASRESKHNYQIRINQDPEASW